MATPSQRCIHYSEIRNFGSQQTVHSIPDLTILQTSSYKNFLQEDTNPRQRKDQGLEAVLREIFPIESYDKKVRLEYLYYELEKPRYEPDECRQLRLTYGKPFKIRLRLTKENDATKEVDTSEEDAYLGDLPIMLGGGEFIINGAERVVVSQLHRSPGIDFVSEMDADRKSFSCRVIPERGSWIEVHISRKETVAVRIDQSSKLPVMMLLRAMSPDLSTDADIIRAFYGDKVEEVKMDGKSSADKIEGKIAVGDIKYPNDYADLEKANEIIVESGQAITKTKAEQISTSEIKKVLVMVDPKNRLLLNSLDEDKSRTHEEALLRIYQRLRPGNPPQLEKARDLFHDKFLDTNRYRLGRVGRFRINRKLGLNISLDEMTLRSDDIINAVSYLNRLWIGDQTAEVDDIDHLGNRRLRTIDELASEEIRKGFLKLRRTVQERMNSLRDEITPRQVINQKSISAAIEYFFGRGELSQVVDQTNPLSMLTHERRLSALGPGGLNRKRAGFDVRDVHSSHYGRICPIETPEGTNIGLISSLSIYAKIDEFGFLISPYRKVKNGVLLDEIRWLRADEEHEIRVAPADVMIQLYAKKRIPTSNKKARESDQEIFVPAFDKKDEKQKYVEVLIPSLGENGKHKDERVLVWVRNEKGRVFQKYEREEKTQIIQKYEKDKKTQIIQKSGKEEKDYDPPLPIFEGILKPVPDGNTDSKEYKYEKFTLNYEDILKPVLDENGEQKYEVIFELVRDKNGNERRKNERRLPVYEEILEPVLNENGEPCLERIIVPDPLTNQVIVRYMGDYDPVRLDKVEAVDVSPSQMIGVSAGLIPFLEHDDANRALMGSNMQRQAVPLLISEPPLVATGMEKYAARDSSLLVEARRAGVVTYCDGQRIIITPKEPVDADDVDQYDLRKFVGLNERTCQNQVPIVRVGDTVEKEQILADGASMRKGELCLGRNVLVAFMVWDGFNFEDAIIISEDLVKKDTYTSIHIEEFDTEIRDTKLGREEFTRDIPNVGERALRNLDETGIVRIGTYVKPGDILVGKVTPKSKTELTPEEKLLHAIFGRAGEDVKNESLEVPSGVEGIVIGTQKFSCRMSLTEEERKQFDAEIARAEEDGNRKISETFAVMIEEMESVLGAQLTNEYGDLLVHDQNYKFIAQEARRFQLDIFLQNGEFSDEMAEKLRTFYKMKWHYVESAINASDRRLNSMKRGDELRRGVLQMVKVYIAAKRVVSVGDKMAGRHGNKGVIAKVLPREDMPFLEDGTPIEIMLNPLGVPSRMNVGQILETHLGWAAARCGYQAVTPVFDGATEKEINKCLEEAGLPEHGKVKLYDGRTGEPFEQETTVGYIYMLKLHHLVDDKVHARSTGPYSLITQQPLGGKARFGGQRFGEMEVWALEAYGAAYTLQELLTVKSDDVEGRTKIYESMVKGENTLEAGTPASFDVLTNEIRGLALNMQLEKSRL